MDDHVDIRENLEALFLAARGDAARQLRALGIPLAVAETQTTVTRDAVPVCPLPDLRLSSAEERQRPDDPARSGAAHQSGPLSKAPQL